MFFTKHVSLLSLVPELKNYFVRFYSNTPDFIIRDSVIYVNGFLLFTCRRNKRLSDRIKYYRLLPVIRIPRREKKIFYINKKKKLPFISRSSGHLLVLLSGGRLMYRVGNILENVFYRPLVKSA